jgi:hypothetical protein
MEAVHGEVKASRCRATVCRNRERVPTRLTHLVEKNSLQFMP